MYNSATIRTDAREEKGCHTALREIYYHWAGATWIIEGDISDREGKKPLVATWGGIPLTWDIKATIQDRPGPQWNRRSELEERLLAQTCEVCGATRMTT